MTTDYDISSIIKISIVTINYRNQSDLYLSCNSIDSQSIHPFEHIVIASGYTSEDCSTLQTSLRSDYRKFIFNADSGIYNAMNIGMRHAQGEYILFLNSGDYFYSRDSLWTAARTLSITKSKPLCFCFSSIQAYNEDYYFRPPFKLSRNQKYGFPHQSFFSPLPSEKDDRCYFNESNLISSDQEWMQSCINLYGFESSYIPISVFQLGGLSSSFSLKNVFKHAKSAKYTSALKSFLKSCMVILIGSRCLYRLLGLVNGYARLP